MRRVEERSLSSILRSRPLATLLNKDVSGKVNGRGLHGLGQFDEMRMCSRLLRRKRTCLRKSLTRKSDFGFLLPAERCCHAKVRGFESHRLRRYSKRVILNSLKYLGCKRGAFLHSFCTLFIEWNRLRRMQLSDFENIYASALRLVSEANTSASTAACAACFAGEITCV